MKELDDSVRIVQESCNDEELKAFRRGIGYVLSELQDRITDPIFREHMDLVPEGIDYAPLPGLTLAQIAAKSR